MEDEQLKDEVTALESIYTSEEFSYSKLNNHYECILKAFVNLNDNFYLTYKDTRKNDELPEEKILISRLPPIILCVKLPNDYPTKSSPEFSLRCSWLHQQIIAKLCKKLDDIWIDNKGQEILFTWMSFLQFETLEYLNIINNLNINHAYTSYNIYQEKINKINNNNIISNDNEACGIQNNNNNKLIKQKKKKNYKNKNIIDERAIVDRPRDKNPVQYFIDYNDSRLLMEFKKNYFICKICFLDKSGESCTQFKPCMHVFCKECISGYIQVKITDGAVKNISCPEEKCTSEATPGQIKELISPELFAKYDDTLLSATLDTMMDIIYCPRKDCQYPVSKEANEKMASCPSCQYTFCIYCKMVYHGVEPCRVIGNKNSLIKEYINASEKKKLELESRYGKKQLRMYLENTMSENWITSNGRHCPQCNTAIEKTDGCNKMTCGRCQTFFCWTCSERLCREKPYSHYENPRSKCFMKLYQGLAGIEDDEEDEFNFEDIDFPAEYIGLNDSDDDFSDEDFVIDLDL